MLYLKGDKGQSESMSPLQRAHPKTRGSKRVSKVFQNTGFLPKTTFIKLIVINYTPKFDRQGHRVMSSFLTSFALVIILIFLQIKQHTLNVNYPITIDFMIKLELVKNLYKPHH